jgi:hypothetical protein
MELPIKPDYAPNIFATVSIYQAVEANDYDWTSYRDKLLISAQAELIVPADDRRLTVSVTSDRPTAAPGESIDLSVQVTGADGAPAQAEVSVAVVDESIFLLSGDLSADLFEIPTVSPNRADYESLRPTRLLGRSTAAAAAAMATAGRAACAATSPTRRCGCPRS